MESEPTDSGGRATGADGIGPSPRPTGLKAPLFGLIALALMAGGVFLVGFGPVPNPLGGSDEPGMPPAGSIWFGATFDPQAGLSGRLTTVSLHQGFSAVAHLTQPMDGSELRVRTWWEGKLESSRAANATGTLAIWNFSPEPLSAVGVWTYDFTDVSGIVLASGTITATRPPAALQSVAPVSPGPSSGTTPPADMQSPTATELPKPAAPSPTPSVRPSVTPRPTPPPAPQPTSSRFAVLTRCPGTPDCWVYTVRQGDNLYSIARYFGVPLAAIERRNPWTRTTGLIAGQKLQLPTPTR